MINPHALIDTLTGKRPPISCSQAARRGRVPSRYGTKVWSKNYTLPYIHKTHDILSEGNVLLLGPAYPTWRAFFMKMIVPQKTPPQEWIGNGGSPLSVGSAYTANSVMRQTSPVLAKTASVDDKSPYHSLRIPAVRIVGPQGSKVQPPNKTCSNQGCNADKKR